MGQVHQMQLTYVPTEDRLLFRMSTKNRQEFRFWMTRRYAGLLWTSLTNVIAKADAGKGPEDAEASTRPKDPLVESTMAEMKHREMVAKSDFETEYQESAYLPLGEQPGLLFSVVIKPHPAGPAMLCMHPEKGQGVEMVLSEEVAHSLCKLIAETTEKAGWALNLTFSDPGASGDSPRGLS